MWVCFVFIRLRINCICGGGERWPSLSSKKKKKKKKQTSMQNTRAHVKCTRTHGSFERPEMSGGNFWPTCFYPYGSDLLVARSAFGIKNNNTLSRNSYSSLHAVPKPLAHVFRLCVHFSFILSNSHQVTSANYTCPAGDSHLNKSINSISRIHIKKYATNTTTWNLISLFAIAVLCAREMTDDIKSTQGDVWPGSLTWNIASLLKVRRRRGNCYGSGIKRCCMDYCTATPVKGGWHCALWIAV